MKPGERRAPVVRLSTSKCSVSHTISNFPALMYEFRENSEKGKYNFTVERGIFPSVKKESTPIEDKEQAQLL